MPCITVLALGWKSRPLESPFSGIRLKREETVKRAVPTDVIKKLASLELKEEPGKQLAVDMALFSFLACGIPFVDIAHLTKANLEEGGKVLAYYRQKTRCPDPDGGYSGDAAADRPL